MLSAAAFDGAITNAMVQREHQALRTPIAPGLRTRSLRLDVFVTLLERRLMLNGLLGKDSAIDQPPLYSAGISRSNILRPPTPWPIFSATKTVCRT
jgi:hypothetical protein